MASTEPAASGGQEAAGLGGRRLGATSFFPQPFGVRIGSGREAARFPVQVRLIMKGLILAQNERWRRGLGMQVERVRRKADQWRKGE